MASNPLQRKFYRQILRQNISKPPWKCFDAAMPPLIMTGHEPTLASYNVRKMPLSPSPQSSNSSVSQKNNITNSDTLETVVQFQVNRNFYCAGHNYFDNALFPNRVVYGSRKATIRPQGETFVAACKRNQ